MTASPNSPRSGEKVSEAQAYNQILLDIVESQVDSVADEIGRHQLPNDLDGIEARVTRVRLQLELVEDMIATQREVADDE